MSRPNDVGDADDRLERLTHQMAEVHADLSSLPTAAQVAELQKQAGGASSRIPGWFVSIYAAHLVLVGIPLSYWLVDVHSKLRDLERLERTVDKLEKRLDEHTDDRRVHHYFRGEFDRYKERTEKRLDKLEARP